MGLGDPKNAVLRVDALNRMVGVLAAAEGATEASWWLEYLIDRVIEKWVYRNPYHEDRDFDRHLYENMDSVIKRHLSELYVVQKQEALIKELEEVAHDHAA
ncbi:MAG: hypothetical protein A2W25_12165 [candidate division Zixibacteria bacterium RBG_16_53_22]|nr:MAG: hypothetical protein A2W25_12165 [candidate division Zixibacteria bacterium RBG_16_53_22]